MRKRVSRVWSRKSRVDRSFAPHLAVSWGDDGQLERRSLAAPGHELGQALNGFIGTLVMQTAYTPAVSAGSQQTALPVINLPMAGSALVQADTAPAPPEYFLDNPNNGVSAGVGTGVVPAGVTGDGASSDTSTTPTNGALSAAATAGWTTADYFGDGGDVNASSSGGATITVTTAAAGAGNQAIGLNASQFSTAVAGRGEAEAGFPIAADTALGTTNGGPIEWTTSGGEGIVTLSGTVSLTFSAGTTGPAGAFAGNLAFNSSATGVAVGPGATGGIVVTIPDNGQITTYTDANFFTTGGSLTVPYSITLSSPPGGENINYASGEAATAVGDRDGQSTASATLNFNFTESIASGSGGGGASGGSVKTSGTGWSVSHTADSAKKPAGIAVTAGAITFSKG
jgi:hypothetical protein